MTTRREESVRVTRPATRAAESPIAGGLSRQSRTAQRAAARRRRIVVRILVGIALVVGAVSVTGIIPVWSAAVPTGLVVVFLFVARRQVRRASDAYWQAAAAARPAASNVVRRSAVRVDSTHGAVRRVSGTGTSKDGDEEPTVIITRSVRAESVVTSVGRPDAADESSTPPSDAGSGEGGDAALIAESRVVAVAIETSDGGSLWDPLPITLPTYVDKKAAPRTVRNIDLNPDAAWSSERATEAWTADWSRDAEDPSGDTAPVSEVPDADESDEELRAANG